MSWCGTLPLLRLLTSLRTDVPAPCKSPLPNTNAGSNPTSNLQGWKEQKKVVRKASGALPQRFPTIKRDWFLLQKLLLQKKPFSRQNCCLSWSARTALHANKVSILLYFTAGAFPLILLTEMIPRRHLWSHGTACFPQNKHAKLAGWKIFVLFLEKKKCGCC